jgi:hypothetical protein
MKRIVFIAMVLVSPLFLFAQEQKYEYTPKVKNKVEFVNMTGKVILKNTSGNTIIIKSDYDVEVPERAEGLKLLGAVDDNTNMGLNVSEKNGIVAISGVSNKITDFTYTISIPEGISVNLDYSNPFVSSDVEVNSYAGSLEIKTLSANVVLKDCTGPLTVNSVSGNIEVVFSKLNQDEPTSLVSVSGFVDVSLSEDTKASFEISNTIGAVYNNLDLQKEKSGNKSRRAQSLTPLSQRKVHEKYTLNGGGVNLYLKTVSGDIYLRKNK